MSSTIRETPSDTRLPLISISIPVLNEIGNIDRLYQRLDALSKALSHRCRMEFVISDNQSSDGTWERIGEIAAGDPRVRAIRFSKNVGFQRSIMANYLHTRGDAVMQVDADLQDPPELLDAFLDLWDSGYDVVYGVRRGRKEAAWVSLFRRCGYWFINRMAEYPIPPNVGDFRLIDRKVINALAKLRSANPYLRGMIAGLGFKQTGIVYDREARVAGESKFGFSRLMRLGFIALINHSTVPLRIAFALGLSMICLSLLGVVYYIFLWLLVPDLPRGLASIHILVLFGIGFQSLLFGILGEYILQIYTILRGEPIAIVANSVNIDEAELKL